MILANFGGPRDLEEITPFLEELLCDRDVVWTSYPSWIHNFLFRKIARKRAAKVQIDYERIGGGSPIYSDTEKIAEKLGMIPFHRYLPATHAKFFEQVEALSTETITVLPLFPQFTYATSGSIARFFQKNLSSSTRKKLRWVHSYFDHPLFINSWKNQIQKFLETHQIQDPILLCSAHGIPQAFVEKGDPYQFQCEKSFEALMGALPHLSGKLSYQSKFGPGEWLRPYTDEMTKTILSWNREKKPVVFVPLSFTSDHIETLYEIEHLYLPVIRSHGVEVYRCPAFNQESEWIETLCSLSGSGNLLRNDKLVRRRGLLW